MGFYIYLALGFLGGIPAGMGMGGGTVTFAFLPMSLPALRVHAKNGLLRKEGILWIVLPALAFSALGALLAHALPGDVLRRAVRAFVVVRAGFQLRGVFTSGKAAKNS